MTANYLMPGSIPIKLLSLKGTVAVQWVEAAGADYSMPFLANTIKRQIAQGYRQRLMPIDELMSLPSGQAPLAFIFHMSRCGSTLVSRMLAAVDRFHVVSEPPVVNQLLSGGAVISNEQRGAILHGLINALAPAAQAGKQAYFVKLSSWNSVCLSLFKHVYPRTPWIFIYRDPIEVLRSHWRRPASWLRNGHVKQLCAELDGQIDRSLPTIAQTAQLLAAVCVQVLQHYDPLHSLLLNYSGLPNTFCEQAPGLIGLDLSESDRQGMLAVCDYHSKDVKRLWAGDPVAMPDGGMVTHAAELYLKTLYEQLDDRRNLRV